MHKCFYIVDLQKDFFTQNEFFETYKREHLLTF